MQIGRLLFMQRKNVRNTHSTDGIHRKCCTLQVVVYSNEHAQRHVKLVGLVRHVECDTISKIFVGTPAACVRPEDVLHTVTGIVAVIIEELQVYLLHLLK